MQFHALALVLMAPLLLGADAPATRPANVDPAHWQRMLDIDWRSGQIKDLVADFEQQKFTALLKKPLISRGQVFVRGTRMLWKTDEPELSLLQITEREVRIYFPAQRTIEVFQVRQKLGQLATSPVPRLETLRQHFSFEVIDVAEMGEKNGALFFAVRMAPTDKELAEHVEQVRVLLDAQRGLIIRLEMRDSDGDRTLVSFSNVKTNVGLEEAELQIRAPADVKVTRPLAGVEGASPAGPEDQ